MASLPNPDVEPVLADLRDRGYETTRLDDPASPAAVATGGQAPDAVTDRPLSVEPLARASPLRVVAALADAAADRRATLFVADPAVADDVRSILADPFLLRAEHDGCRTFYDVPDRIQLPEGGFAGADTAETTWREEPATDGVTGDGDDPRLLLESDDGVVAALPSVDGLTCPGPDTAAFPYRYYRGPEGRIHVADGERDLGTFTSITAMRQRGFHPVALPLVPEHHLRENAGLARRWTVAAVDGDDVRYLTD
jgi:hypothetical protein